MPEPYTIASRYPNDPDRQAEAVQYHLGRIAQERRACAMERVGLEAEQTRLLAELAPVQAKLADIDAKLLRNTAHDRVVLAMWMHDAKPLDGLRRKSLDFGAGILGCEAKTRKRARLAWEDEQVPEELRLAVPDKTAIRAAYRLDKGRVIDAQGEVLEGDAIPAWLRVEEGEREDVLYVTVGDVTMPLEAHAEGAEMEEDNDGDDGADAS